MISALGDILLAYDTEKLFQHTAQLFFTKPNTPFEFLRHRKPSAPPMMFGNEDDLRDAIAFIHLLSFPVKDPARMQSALRHLQQVTTLSRQSWKAIMAETDDDHEWLPNPRQTSVFGGAKVTEEQIRQWFAFLDEMDAILAGRKLIPFWRMADGRGINLRRVFAEPKELDLILWIQGSAAAPYLEKGEITADAFWNTTNQVFRGNFMGFALWSN